MRLREGILVYGLVSIEDGGVSRMPRNDGLTCDGDGEVSIISVCGRGEPDPIFDRLPDSIRKSAYIPSRPKHRIVKLISFTLTALLMGIVRSKLGATVLE